MRNPPESVRNSWPVPNYDDPVNHGASLHVVGIILIVLSAVTVFLRLYVRLWILHTPGLDDWLILFSLIPGIGMTTSTLLGTRFGWGRHIWDSPPEWSTPSLLVSWISQLLFVITVTFVKLSVCYSYQRLSDKRSFTTILTISKIFILVWGVTFTCTVLFRCWPTQIYWTDLGHRSDECMDENIPLLTSSITNLFTDVWLVALPIPILANLKLPFRQRMILIVLMSLGFVACIAGIVRVYYLHKTLMTTYDVTWEGYNIWLWTAVEVDLGIITSSVPPLRPLVRRHFPRLIEPENSFSAGDGRGSCVPAEFQVQRDSPDTPGRIMSTVMGTPRRTTFAFEPARSAHLRDSEDMEMASIFDRKREDEFRDRDSGV
ncbi:hypothetical protein FPV67DRAFT_1442959 [Lyophyllum atratum]|nr:hypothetical protein FPV67DRAFT_1442959 [Lyophyllum atratum]